MLIRFIKKGFRFLRNQHIDIRIRLLYLMEYAAFTACIIGTISMMMYASSLLTLIPNLGLLIFSGLGLYFSHAKRKYDFAANLVIIGCTCLCLPAMFFTAGGNNSGMPLWFAFGVIFSTFMSSGRSRIIMPFIAFVISTVCILLGHFFSEGIIPLKDSSAEFVDLIMSFALVCIFICITLYIYLSTYDRQRRELEKQRCEMANLLNTDALTGIANRRAYYEETGKYSEGGETGDLVLAAMDVNGLKSINDSLGHSAGDEYIKSAAEVILSAFSDYGRIFRTGGDEFIAVLHCSREEADGLGDRLDEAVRTSAGKWSGEMTIAVGIVCCADHPQTEFSEIEKMADALMYENKSEHYRRTGTDRRKNRI